MMLFLKISRYGLTLGSALQMPDFAELYLALSL